MNGVTIVGKTVIITGASSGIGLATARLLYAEGANLVIASNDAAALAKTQAELTGGRGKVHSVVVNTALPEDHVRLVAEALKAFGHLDCAVNNAGVFSGGDLTATTTEQWDFLHNINLRGTFYALQAQVPALIANGGGAIVNISSLSALVGAGGIAAYTASKAGIIGLTKATAREVVDHGIRVNVLVPGSTDTPMSSGVPPEQAAAINAIIPMKRMGQPEEMARAVLFLLRDATFSTGLVLPIDGGVTG